MYSKELDEKFIDKELRSSIFKTYKNKELFNLFKLIVSSINTNDKLEHFKLVENDITHIKYKEGDFFEKHDDYLSVTSNIITEYTMILCKHADCEGGHTIFYFNDYFTYKSKASKTTGNCIIFRKDICHEAEKIVSGHKEILTANLWCIENKSETVVVITFDNTNKKYVINYSNILFFGNTLIKMAIDFNIANETVNCTDKIYEYNTNTIEYEQFNIIASIYNKEYISAYQKQRLEYTYLINENKEAYSKLEKMDIGLENNNSVCDIDDTHYFDTDTSEEETKQAEEPTNKLQIKMNKQESKTKTVQ